MSITKQQAEELKAAIDKMVEPEKATSDEWPKFGDRCYWLGSDGHISNIEWQGGGAHPELKLRNNIYRARQEAELADKRRLAYVELVNAIKKANNGWKPDWKNKAYDQHLLYYCDGAVCTDSWSSQQHASNELYCKDKHLLHQIVESLGVEKIKLAMGWI